MKKCKPRRRHMQTTHSQDAAEILPRWSRHHGPMLARIQANEIETELLGINSNCCLSSHIYCLSSIQYAIHFPSMFMWFHTWFCTHPINISNREKEKNNNNNFSFIFHCSSKPAYCGLWVSENDEHTISPHFTIYTKFMIADLLLTVTM